MFQEWHWEITTGCNLVCLDCITMCGRPRNGELSGDEAIRAIRVMKDLGCRSLMITGGEPLCCEFLHDVFRECSLREIDVSFLTNGFLIGRDFARDCSDFVESVGVSLDGPSSEVNDRVRGVGSFDKASRAISILSDFVQTTVYIVASRNNIDDLEATIKLAFSLGADSVHVSEIDLRGRAAENAAMFELSEDQRRQLKVFAKKKTAQADPVLGCNADFSTLYVSSEGLVYPCSEVAIRVPEKTLGLITAKGFRKSLRFRKGAFMDVRKLCCCYQVYAGKGFVFVLNSKDTCSLSERRW